MLMRQKKIPSKLETFGPEKYKRTLLGYFESETARILQSGEFGKGVFERTINDMGRHAKEGSAGPDFLKEALQDMQRQQGKIPQGNQNALSL